MSEENQRRLGELIKALKNGFTDENGTVLRQEMTVYELEEKLRVVRSTFWSWRWRWPRNSASLEHVSEVVGAGDAAFQKYFEGGLSLKELLSLGKTVRPRDSLEDVWTRFLQLDLPDQLQFESRVLMRRAEFLESPGQTTFTTNQEKVATAPNSANLLSGLDKGKENMAEVGGRWMDKELLRVQSLFQESLRKRNREKHPIGAAEDAGVRLSSFDQATLIRLESATLDELRYINFAPGLVNAIAAICYEVVGWHGVVPSGLHDSTYRDQVENLLRDLSNHEHQQA